MMDLEREHSLGEMKWNINLIKLQVIGGPGFTAQS